MYTIGLIDDEQSELVTIRRTIKVNAPQNVSYGFKTYSIKNDYLVNDVCDDIVDDIKNKKITSLIIDYKIMVESFKIKGTDILKKIGEIVPKFPIVILTERVEESIKPNHVDADKVYSKKDFFKIAEGYSKEKINNIFGNMRKYVTQRDNLLVELSEFQNRLENGDRSSVENILKLEERLDGFIPVGQTQIDKMYDADKVRHIVNMIKEANNLLEKKNEA